jgi:hypothetical protein
MKLKQLLKEDRSNLPVKFLKMISDDAEFKELNDDDAAKVLARLVTMLSEMKKYLKIRS